MTTERRKKRDDLCVFVTVGTTQFDQLIQTIASLEVLQVSDFYLAFCICTLRHIFSSLCFLHLHIIQLSY